MKLLVYKFGELTQEAQLEGGTVYTVGRQMDCDIVLEKMPGISRKHFEMREETSGVWKVHVLSKVKSLEFQGQEEMDFTIQDQGEFFLSPYRFVFEMHDSQNEGSEGSYYQSDMNISPPPSGIQTSDPEAMETDQQEGHFESGGSFSEGDQKTIIQNFDGVPYIKIIGQNGKKSEYFRLEGNLWVVGNDDNASVYLRDSSAAKNHFEISKTEKGFSIVDSGSSQGTDLNGQKLESGKPSRLLSGDIISVGRTSIQFELRDKSFRKKVHNIPMSLYKNPLVFFDQEIAMVSLDERIERQKPGEVRQALTQKANNKKKGKKWIMVLVALLVVALSVGVEISKQNSEDKKDTMATDPFSQLSPVEQQIIKQTHKLAKQLYLSGNFELSLVQLEKLHSIIPGYKDSREIEEYCINSRELKHQQAMIEKQKRDQEEMANRVHSLVAQCTENFKNSHDVDAVRACLAPASDLDPSHPGISQLISEVTARIEERRIREKMAQEEAEKIRRGNELYEKARLFHAKNNYLEAIEAYENHIHSGLPDPKRLVRKSKRHLSSIEKMIETQKTKLVNEAKSMYGDTKLKEAIILARQAQKVDPYDSRISVFLFNIEKELKTKMKNIYVDSVIEERFGNLEASRVKWETILKLDMEDGEYYTKAKRKLKQYGYQY